MKRLLLLTVAILLVIVVFVACGANPAGESALITVTAPSEPTAPALAPYKPEAAPSTTAPPVQSSLPDGCPQPTADTLLLRYPPGGYCLLYPDSHTAVRGGFDAWSPSAFRIVRGNILSTSPWATVATGDAAGFDPEKTARESAASMAEYGVGLVELEVAGEPAYMVTGIPGQDLTRSLYFNHGDVSYHFTFGPDDAAGSETVQYLDAFADVLLGHLTFIPASETFTAADECLEPRPDEQLIVSESLGFCLLLPATYVQEAVGDSSAIFQSGSAIDADHPQLAVEVADAGSQTAERLTDDLIRQKSEQTGQPVMVTMYTVGDGNILAKMVDGAPGYESERSLIYDHDGRQYRLAFTPYDPEQPELTGAMAELVTLVTQSFRFLP